MPPVSILSALADQTRCRIVEILHAGAQPVHALAAQFDISRPAISRHLRVLREAGLVSEKKTGRENLYVLHVKRLAPAEKWLTQFNPRTAMQSEVEAKHAPAQEAPKATVKSASKRKPVAKVVRTIAEPADAEAVPTAPKTSKPAQQAPISQMGFDF